ncbi:MAG: glutamyl-tRNA synthetase [Patescibacteria group bacterium]|nr:glutamyl-tRNA synthetase [Patescibacteria group bacterium]
MSSPKPVRVRFAPSPTGFLHIGGVRTALFNYLFAKKHGGQFILRLEDTDRERFVEAGVEQISEVLNWLGLAPDEGYWEGEHNGDLGPYIQSQRLPEYENYAQQLVDTGLAYKSHISPEAFQQLRQAAIDAKKPFVYRREYEPDGSDNTHTGPIRLDVQAVHQKLVSSEIVWEDAVRGTFAVNWNTIDDFILIKADGFPTYNFANIIDDHLMDISHILRGDEFISSTPKHAILYDVLGFTRPTWAHLPVILGADGSKLSKRHGDTDALQYRDKGYLPEALLNFLALLGWNDGTEQEIFSLDELIQNFSLERIQKSPAKFDMDRLNWMNGMFIREKLSEEEYIERAFAVLKDANLPNNDQARAAVLLELERIKSFSELPELVEFFFVAPSNFAEIMNLIHKKVDSTEAKPLLDVVVDTLEKVPEKIDSDQLETLLRDLAQELNVKTGQLFYIIRCAITGKTAAPGLFETILTLGLPETIARLRATTKRIE